MVEPRFAHLQDTREIHQGELWLTKRSPTFPEPRPGFAPSQPQLVVILSPDDVNNDPDSLDIRVALLSAQVAQASELDLKLDLSQDVQFDQPDDRAVLAQDQIIELWNDQGMLKVNLDCRLGLCSARVQGRIKQVLRWSYGVEPCAEVPSWVGRPIADEDDPRLRFQDQEREATRCLRDPVEQFYRLLMADEDEETEEESALDTTEEAEDRAAFEAWQEEILRENYERDERLSRFVRDYLRPEDLAILRGPCPDTPTFVAYQQGDLPVERAEEIQQHVVFCRACLEELVALGRADAVDYDPERDYETQGELSPALRQELFGTRMLTAVTVLVAAIAWQRRQRRATLGPESGEEREGEEREAEFTVPWPGLEGVPGIAPRLTVRCRQRGEETRVDFGLERREHEALPPDFRVELVLRRSHPRYGLRESVKVQLTAPDAWAETVHLHNVVNRETWELEGQWHRATNGG